MLDPESARAAAESDPWPFGPVSTALDLSATALLVIDMQYFDASPDLGLGRAIAHMGQDGGRYYFDRLSGEVVPNIASLITSCRRAGLRVIYIVAGPETQDGADLLPRVRARRRQMSQMYGVSGIYSAGSREHDILDELVPAHSDLVIGKNTTSAFTASSLDHTLRMLNISTICFTGVVTNVCIESSLRDGSDLGYTCILVEDGCAAYDEEAQRSTVRNCRRVFGIVSATSELLSSIEASAGANGR